jgi:hypothetical protein
MQVIVGEKPRILLISYPCIYQNYPISFYHKKATHGPGTKVIFIGRVSFLPQLLRHHTKHSAAIELKESGIYKV